MTDYMHDLFLFAVNVLATIMAIATVGLFAIIVWHWWMEALG